MFSQCARFRSEPSLALLLQAQKDLLASFHKYALLHKECIDKFGRFPHRNAILGRKTTEAEAAYLAAGGGFG